MPAPHERPIIVELTASKLLRDIGLFIRTNFPGEHCDEKNSASVFTCTIGLLTRLKGVQNDA